MLYDWEENGKNSYHGNFLGVPNDSFIYALGKKLKGIRKPISKDSDVMVDAPTRKTLFEDCSWRSFMRYLKTVRGHLYIT